MNVGAHRVTLSIDGMTCASCVATIEGAVGRLPGVRKVQVALLAGKGEVEVAEAATTDAAAIVAAVNDTGYTASLLADEPLSRSDGDGGRGAGGNDAKAQATLVLRLVRGCGAAARSPCRDDCSLACCAGATGRPLA